MQATLEHPDVQEPLGQMPRLRDDLIVEAREFAGQACYVIEDPMRGRFFRLGLPEYEVLRRLDGETTIASAVGESATHCRQALSPQESLALCRWLSENELLDTGKPRLPREQPCWRSFNPLAIKLPLVNPDRFLATLLPWFAWLFSRWFLVVWTCVCLYAGSLVLLHAGSLADAAHVILNADNWWRLFAVWLALKIVHETAHGLACRHFGGHVTRAGMMLVFLAPVAYVDVTSSWRFHCRWHRIVTAAAGMYVELFIAALAVIAWTQMAEGLTRRLLLDLAMMASASTLLVNANPLMRFDGYFMFSDWTGIPNLSSCGRQWLFDRLQRVLGLRPAALPWPKRSRRIIAVYGVAALLWKTFVYAALSLALIAWLSYAGGLLVAAILFACGARSTTAMLRRLQMAASGQRLGPRLALLGVAGGACLLLALLLLLRPAWISAPGVVEYSQLALVRAASPGFVQKVLVAVGQEVNPGEPLIELRNDELTVELADLNLALKQSLLRARMHQQSEEQAKYQAELAVHDSLLKKRAEIQTQVQELLVRAPRAGRLSGRNLETLTGQYLHAGDEICVLGQEAAKELLFAAAQDDGPLFRSRRGQPVAVRVEDSRCDSFEAALGELDPRATNDPPHPALLATLGGPLPAVPRATSADESSADTEESQLSTPCFAGHLMLTPQQSQYLRSGQRVTLGFRSSQETIASHLLRTLDGWLHSQLRRTDQRP